ncbi:MAG: tetratricopeptide repeat protein [Akkermansiaceae bacterium]|jgi:tetratricopeptide (TPR) repeat protein|nr:tetratricopeptide repeat protein [Akkermansiaceae bacterium]
MSAVDFPTARIHECILEGRMLDAWELASATGVPLGQWPQGEARRTAARLAAVLGNSRLGNLLDYLNWRADRDHPRWFFQALFARSRCLPEYRIIEEITRYLQSHPSISASDHSDLLALRASQRSGLRDFTSAFDDIHKALELQPLESWIHVIHSACLEEADRYDEALVAARRAVELRPRYASAVSQCADCLIHLGRDEEAMQLLQEATDRTQNAAFPMRLQTIHSEREDHAAALVCLDLIEARNPLMTESLRRWIDGRRGDFHYLAGRFDLALENFDKAGPGFQESIARTLREPGAFQRRRVRLDVPFTRQHSMTCAPATLASLAAYWQRPHDHLEIAAAICHEGTPWHKERRWAEEHGFHTAEFRLTPESLRDLIDRGIPFTLTTQATTSAHLQACIGYDYRTGVILLRDPTERHYVEMILATLLRNHPIGGPRGMVMIPRELSARLDGLELPDSAIYDAFHELLVALDGHDRLAVDAAMTGLRVVGRDAPLVAEGAERVALWKNDHAGRLAALDAQLAFAPDHQPSLLQKAYVLRRLGRGRDLRVMLEEIVRRPEADPVFVCELGELLLEDARCIEAAGYYLRKAARRRRREGRVHASLAFCLAKQQQHQRAASLHRIAASLTPGFDPYARNYLDTCRIIRRQDEAIDFLRERTQRSGTKSGGVWFLLADALNQLDRQDEAAAVLEQGAVARPDDGEFLLLAGSMMAGWGEPHRSRGLEMMRGSRGRTSETSWLAENARIAAYLGDRAMAIRCWRALVGLEPRNIDAWRGLASGLADSEGPEAAIALLDEAVATHPDFTELHTLLADHLRGTRRGPLAALDRALELDPGLLWALRERSTTRMETGDRAGAEADAREAIARHPWDPAGHGCLAWILEKAGEIESAARSYRDAIRLDIDYTFASRRLIGLHAETKAKQADLDFIFEEMNAQVSNGAIVSDYQELAWALVEPPVLLGRLQTFCEQRPDLWQTWSARIEQALRMGFEGEALSSARTLVERFPLMPRAWLELARVHRNARRHAEEEAATSRAVHLSPGWDIAAREHAQVLEILGRAPEAVQVLKRACELDPLTGANHGCLADTLRRLQRDREALDALLAGLRLCPYYSWGWEKASTWARMDDRIDEVARLLDFHAAQLGHNRHWWAIAADSWESLGDKERTLDAIQRGLGIDPKDPSLRDKLAYHHFQNRDYAAALAACAAVPGENVAPVNLRGRHAWILLHSGQPQRGLEAMKKLLVESPDYSWGFGEVATWLEERQNWQELRDHARAWLRAAPNHTRALACLGLAERQLGQPDAARAAYSRAHALDPEYAFVARQLLDLQMDAGKYDDARSTLATLRHYSPGVWVTADAVELELRQSATDAALAEVAGLLDDPAADRRVFGWLAELFERHRATNAWRAWLTTTFRDSLPAAPGAITAWLAILPAKGLVKKAMSAIERYPEQSPPRIAGWTWLIGQLAGDPKSDDLRKWADARHPELHRHPVTWNAMGEALLRLGEYRKGVDWLADWESRGDEATDETFLHLAALHDGCPGDDHAHWQESGRLRAEGLRRFPDHGCSQFLRAGHALHLAVAGKLEETSQVMADFEPGRVSEYYGALGQLVEAILAASARNEEASRKCLEKAHAYFIRVGLDPGSLRLLRRTHSAIASHLPWTRSHPGKLLKKWGLQLKPGGASPASKIPIWFLVVAGYVILRACLEATKS